jgi:LuxR family transcriptional regulator, quorum-sensing system regulator BjaR1
MKDSSSPDTALFMTVAQFRLCRTAQEVGALLIAALTPFGMKNYAIGGMPTPADPNPTSFMFHNWPEEWQKLYFEQNFAAVDPVPRAAMTTSMPLTIGEIRAGKAGFVPGPEANAYFEAGERLVGGKGLVVPICGPHGYHGIVALVGENEDFSDEDRAKLHLLAIYAHDRLLDLFGRSSKPNGMHLSSREVEVMRHARNGLGDEAIAQQLGISARTVRFHFENARHKLGVKTRAEALVTAVGLHLLGS